MRKNQPLLTLVAITAMMLVATTAANAQLCKKCILDTSTHMYECWPSYDGTGWHLCVDGSLPYEPCYVGGNCQPELTDDVSTTRPDGAVISANEISAPNSVPETPDIDLAGESYIRNCQGTVVRRFYTRSRAATLRRASEVITI